MTCLRKQLLFFRSLLFTLSFLGVLSLVLWFGFLRQKLFFVAMAGLKQMILLSFVSDSPGLG